MNKHLSSKYRDPRIEAYKLDQLSPMCLHDDGRYLTRDVPRIEHDGLWYPILLYKVTPQWWAEKFAPWPYGGCNLLPPVINEDGMVWAVKMGSNRWEAAVHLGYDSIDAIMFGHSDDCVKLGVWFRDCDPLHNSDCPPYTGAWEYN